MANWLKWSWVVLLAGLIYAADDGGQAGAARRPQLTYSYAKNNPTLKFLGLTAEQSDKIDALQKESSQATTKLYNDRPQGKDPAVLKEFYEKVSLKRKELQDELTKKILDVLTDEQKTKFKAAEEAREACETAMKDARIKAINEREDKLIQILGDGYKEEAERQKKMAANTFAGLRPAGGQ